MSDGLVEAHGTDQLQRHSFSVMLSMIQKLNTAYHFHGGESEARNLACTIAMELFLTPYLFLEGLANDYLFADTDVFFPEIITTFLFLPAFFIKW